MTQGGGIIDGVGPKPSLEDRLDALGLKYQRSGRYLRGGFNVGDGRRQRFIIDSEVDEFLGYGDHDFMSVIGQADDLAKMKEVCVRVGSMKRGGVVILEDMVVLKFEVPADADADTMRGHIEALCFVADKLEREIYKTDSR